MYLQERFLLVKNSSSEDTHDYKWWIPISFTSEDSPNFENTKSEIWMSSDEAEKQIENLPDDDKWVIFNVQEAGYYRVNYEDANWQLLSKQLSDNHDVIHSTNRAQLIDDSLNLASAGQQMLIFD